MKKIIILAGNGELPYNVAKELDKRKLDFFIITFKNNKVSAKLKKYNPIEINFGKIVTELKKLKIKRFDSIIMIGGVKKPKLKELKPDFNSLKLIPMFTKKIIEGGDNNLLSFCIKKIEEIGFKIINIKDVLPELFLGKGVFTKISPKKDMIKDIRKGQKILQQISKFDIGQSIIIQKGNVVGIEGVQGTDFLIKNSKNYLVNDTNAILVKSTKQKQDLRVDLPTVGIKTMKNCKKSNIYGLAFTANNTIFLDVKKIISYCNENKLFLIGV